MFWTIIILIALFVCIIIFPYFRCVVFNPHYTAFYGVTDLWDYFIHKKWRLCDKYVGELVCFMGLFGKGKTLSAVKKVCSLYRRYNGIKVWDRSRKKWVMQQVIVVSNVNLTDVPYIAFESLHQLVKLTQEIKDSDELNDTYTFIVCLADEFSVQMNSRNFKSNIDPLFLNTILTCRHYRLSIYYTAQRFNQVDALLRQVTQTVINCNKKWRLQGLNYYDGYELENCTNPMLVQPIARGCLFITNRDYNAYDTLACVKNLEHSALTGDMLSDSEILEKIRPDMVGADTVVKYSKKARKRKPNHKKYSS